MVQVKILRTPSLALDKVLLYTFFYWKNKRKLVDQFHGNQTRCSFALNSIQPGQYSREPTRFRTKCIALASLWKLIYVVALLCPAAQKMSNPSTMYQWKKRRNLCSHICQPKCDFHVATNNTKCALIRLF